MTATPIASTPEPPYWAVIFTSLRENADDGYAEVAARMAELAVEQPGFLGIESSRGADGLGITVSYWSSEDAIRAWKANAEHRIAQRKGREGFYQRWFTRVCKVERAYAFEL
jgi:heme-degrading monooxygenase HmoA